MVSVNYRKYFLYVLYSILYVFLIGCATPSYRHTARISIHNYIDIKSFCKKHNFTYSFDTIDDIIVLHSQDREIKLLLNSLVATDNGVIFYLKSPPLYYKGKIFFPPQLGTFISRKAITSFKPPLILKTIVLDPGHGGKDPGAISPRGLQEKNLNLIVARYLKEELVKQGFKVVMTRSKDVSLSLSERTKIAKKYNADLFISIHANSNRSKAVQGAEIYYLSPSQLNSHQRALKLAKYSSFYGQKLPFNVKAILWDLLITKNYALSVEVSNILYFTFKNLGFRVKPPKRAPFYVLRFAYVPSVLVEMGYLSNYYEEKALRKKHYQKQIAQAIALAVNSLQKRYSQLSKK